ncbi:MAG: hypothetical protein OXD42_03715, partial [Rhodospirillaceae bacterium]|nr:hypothetical protein [Rhodospirillaceae bacterium]
PDLPVGQPAHPSASSPAQHEPVVRYGVRQDFTAMARTFLGLAVSSDGFRAQNVLVGETL